MSNQVIIDEEISNVDIVGDSTNEVTISESTNSIEIDESSNINIIQIDNIISNTTIDQTITTVEINNQSIDVLEIGESNTVNASGITVDTSNFDGNLSISDDSVQKALDTLDDLIAGAGNSNGPLGSIQFSDGAGNFLSDSNNLFWNNTTGQKSLGIGKQPDLNKKLEVFDNTNDLFVRFGDSTISSRFEITTGGISGDTFITANASSSRAAHQRVISGSLFGDLTVGFGRINMSYSGASYTLRNGATDHFVCRTTGEVGIGTGNFILPAKLSVENTSNQIAFDIKGNSTQTNSYVRIRNNAGNELAGFDERGILFSHGSLNSNFFAGNNAGNVVATGTFNVGIGSNSLDALTTGFNNIGIGGSALSANTSGIRNIAIGQNCLRDNVSGSSNVGIGFNCLLSNTGSSNVGIGSAVLNANTTGTQNLGIGTSALLDNTTGSNNSAFGSLALFENQDGSNNSAFGQNALRFNISGNESVAFGRNALQASLGDRNSGFGFEAGVTITTGSNNLALGDSANVPSATADNQISIKNLIYGIGASGAGAGKVGIGETSPSAKLQITGSSDEVQALIKANSTQTSDIFQIQSSTGNELFTINGSGDATFGSTTLMQKISGSRSGDPTLKLEFPDNGSDFNDGIIIGSTSGSHFQVSSRSITFGSLVQQFRRDNGNILWDFISTDKSFRLYGGLINGNLDPHIKIFANDATNGVNQNSIRNTTGSGNGFFSWSFHQSIDETPITMDIRNSLGNRTDRISSMDGGVWLTSHIDDAVDNQTAWVMRTSSTITQANSKLFSIYNNTNEKMYLRKDGLLNVDGSINISQSNASGAIPVLRLEQVDVSEEMIEFDCAVAVGNGIESVGAKTLTTTHFIKINIAGVGVRYIPAGTIA